jgi:hypothetical protein
MAIPSGSGTEVLKRTSMRQLGGSATFGTWWSIDFTSAQISAQANHTVPAHHIITVLSVVICNTVTGYSYNVDMGVTPSGGTTIELLKDHTVPASGTFTWNDKFALHAGDALLFRSNSDSSGDDFDIYISFIDQDWST